MLTQQFVGLVCMILKCTRILTSSARIDSSATASWTPLYATPPSSCSGSGEGKGGRPWFLVYSAHRCPVLAWCDRICPGRHFAEASLFINIASVLHTFDITPPLDEHGHPVKAVPGMTDGLLSCVALAYVPRCGIADVLMSVCHCVAIRRTFVVQSSHALSGRSR